MESRRVGLVAALLFAVGAAAGLLAPTAATAAEDGSIGIRLTEAPVDRKDDPRARVYIIDHVQPGDSFSRTIEVSNTTGERQRVEVYPGPADINDGAWTVAGAGETSELTDWITTSRGRVSLASGAARRVDVTVEVPEDAFGGERYGVIWASVASAGDGNVQVVNRVGIRVYLSVGGAEEPPSDFEVSTLTPARTEDGTPYVQAQVTNTGERALDLRGQLRLRDGPGGATAGPFTAETGTTLAPEDSAPVTVMLPPDLPTGPWEARLAMSSGELTRRVTAMITFPDSGAGAAVDAEEVGGGFGVGWVAALLLLGALLLAPLVFWLRRRRAPGQDPQAAEEADRAWLESLDQQYPRADGGPP